MNTIKKQNVSRLLSHQFDYKFKEINPLRNKEELTMVCYIVPLAATVVGVIHRKSMNKHDANGFLLNIMLLGGALFGVIDHAWNGELFLLGANWFMDMALGGTITLGIFASWGVIAFKDRLFNPLRTINRRIGIIS